MKRVVRKSLRSGVRDAQCLLESIFIAELLKPSDHLWLVSPWISNICVLDNRAGTFAALLPDAGEREIRLAEILCRLSEAGAKVAIRTTSDPLNDAFLGALAQADPEGQVSVVTRQRLHEKMLAGEGYLVSGSMNFTVSGVERNDEQVALETDAEIVAQVRVALQAEDADFAG
jgi:hypothetical protein